MASQAAALEGSWLRAAMRQRSARPACPASAYSLPRAAQQGARLGSSARARPSAYSRTLSDEAQAPRHAQRSQSAESMRRPPECMELGFKYATRRGQPLRINKPYRMKNWFLAGQSCLSEKRHCLSRNTCKEAHASMEISYHTGVSTIFTSYAAFRGLNQCTAIIKPHACICAV